MEERKIGRRDLLRGALWLAGVASGAYGLAQPEMRDYEAGLWGEDYYHNFVNRQALLCAGECGDDQLSHSLAFDTTDPEEYRLFIPEITAAGLPNVPEGWYAQVVPMLASGEEVSIQPAKPERPNWERNVLTNPVFKGPSDRPLVALTIDDGYFNREDVLQTIIKKDATATFLIIGSIMDAYPDFIKKAQSSGRITWGNHTYTHESLIGKNVTQIKEEYERTEAALKRITGATTIPFARPPGGGKNDTVISAGADLKLRTFLWNVSGDAGTQWSANNPNELANYYMGLIDAQKNPWGSIILMHFRTSTATSNIDGVPSALEQVIDGIRARGMEPVSLDKLYEGGRV